jgi:hypothetical protein
MGFTPTGFTSGNAITVATVEAEFTLLRDWLNRGTVVGDVDAASVKRTHIYRPETFGYPKQSSEGALQEVHEGEFGRAYRLVSDGVDLTGGSNRLAETFERVSIFPNMASKYNETNAASFTIWPTVRRVVIEVQSDVEVMASWSAFVRMAPSAAPTLHPNAGGKFQLSYTKLSTGTKTIRSAGDRNLTTQIADVGHTDSASGSHTYSTGVQITDLATGVYDFALEYAPVGVSSDLAQVIIHPASIVIEVHKQ